MIWLKLLKILYDFEKNTNMLREYIKEKAKKNKKKVKVY